MNMLFVPPAPARLDIRARRAVHLDMGGVTRPVVIALRRTNWAARSVAILIGIVGTLAAGFAAIPGAAHAVLPQLF